MQILVTGARGKVGAATIHDLIEAGHGVTGCDSPPGVRRRRLRRALLPGGSDRSRRRLRGRARHTTRSSTAPRSPSRPATRRTSLPQQPDGDVQRGRGVRTHRRRPARERLQRDRRRMGFADRAFHAPYAPIDEVLANRPQDPYALAKLFGEQLMDAASRARTCARSRSGRPGCSGRATTRESLRRGCATRWAAPPSESFWSYIDVYDLAHALRLAAECCSPATRRSTSPPPTTAPGGRWRS